MGVEIFKKLQSYPPPPPPPKHNRVFKNLTKRSSILLGFEVANRVLSHLTCSAIKESSVDLVSDIFFTKKELNIINYLSGYVFGTFYRVCLAAKVYKSC